MNDSKFSLTIRMLRENSGLTQRQVAEALNMERSTYARYETGGSRPSGMMIHQLANIFGVDYLILLEAASDIEFDHGDKHKNYTSVHDSAFDNSEKVSTLKKDEQDLLLWYRQLTKEQKSMVIVYAKKLYNENIKEGSKALKKIKKNNSEEH